MIFDKTFIEGVYQIKPQPFEDNRGIFRRHFCKEEFKNNNIDYDNLLFIDLRIKDRVSLKYKQID